MHTDKPLLLIGHLFLALVFLCAPVADNAHALRMFQNGHTDTHLALSGKTGELPNVEAHMPCHDVVMVPDETAPPADARTRDDGKKPCCPYEQCSPNDCLMHSALASLPVLDILPHSPIDSRISHVAVFHLASAPAGELLRPPIG